MNSHVVEEITKTYQQTLTTLLSSVQNEEEKMSDKLNENMLLLESTVELMDKARNFQDHIFMETVMKSSAAYLEFSQDQLVRKIEDDTQITAKRVKEKLHDTSECLAFEDKIEQALEFYHTIEENIKHMVNEYGNTQTQINELINNNLINVIEDELLEKKIFTDIITLESLESAQRSDMGNFKRDLLDRAVRREMQNFKVELERKQIESLKMEINSIEKLIILAKERSKDLNKNMDIDTQNL